MFDSVLDRGVAPRRRLAAGAVVSVLGHGAVLSLALLIRPPAPVEETATKVITWPTVPPMFTSAPAPGPAGGGGGGPRAHPAPPRAQKRRELLAPTSVPPKLDLEAPPNETPEVVGAQIGDPFNQAKGDEAHDSGGGGGGGGGSDSGGTCVGGACDFETGMSAPLLVERGREPEFTPEALEAHVQGLMTVQCVVTLEGRLKQCQVIRSLPFMERAVVEALMTRRYTPATLHGRPLAVRYVFHVRLVMPR